MWDGSFKSKRQVSLRGNSARQAGTVATVESARLERERRARIKKEQNASRKIQGALKAVVCRKKLKEWAAEEAKEVIDDAENGDEMKTKRLMALMALSGAHTELTLARRVASVVEDRVRRKDVNALRLVGVVTMAVEVATRIAGDFAVSKLESLSDLCSCVNSVLDVSDHSRRKEDLAWSKAIQLELISPTFRSSLHRPLDIQKVLYTFLMLLQNQDPSGFDKVWEMVYHLWNAIGQSILDDRINENTMISLCMLVLPFTGKTDDDAFEYPSLFQNNFPVQSWIRCLEGIHQAGSPRAVGNVLGRIFSISDRYLNTLRSAKEYQLYAELYIHVLCVASTVIEKSKTSLALVETDLIQFRDPRSIQEQFNIVAEVPDLPTKERLVASLCSFLDLIRIKMTTVQPLQGNISSKSAQGSGGLSALSVSNIVLSSVAFSSRSDPIAKMLWKILMRHIDLDRTSIRPSLLNVGPLNEVMHFVAFTLSATTTLLPALSDEELFLEQVPLDHGDLEGIAVFVRDLLFQALWVQRSKTVTESFGLPLKDSLIPDFVVSKAVELYDQLFERQGRRHILSEDLWLFPHISLEELGVNRRASGRRFHLGQQPQPTQRTPPVGPGAMEVDEEEEMQNGYDDSDSDEEIDDNFKALPEGASPRVKQILELVPSVIPFHQRVLILDHFLDIEHQQHYQGIGRRSVVEIRRGFEFEDAFDQIDLSLSLKDMRIQIEFTNAQGLKEAGIDGGGVFKEFLMEFTKQAFHPENGLWITTSDQKLYPNPDSHLATPDHLSRFTFIGKMLGKAIYEGILCEVEFADFFLNLILGRKNHIHDLQSLDSELYKNLLRLKEMDDPSNLCLTFSASRPGYQPNTTREVNLIPNGSATMVTKENLIYYMRRLSNFRLNEEVQEQAAAFLSGFTDLIDISWIRMFKPRELQLVISGSNEGYKVEDMERFCTYSAGYHPSQPYIIDFWNIVSEFNAEQKGLLLKFITSCSKPPLQGFGALNPRLCISQVPIQNDSDRLATSSTCVNLLKLPKYSSKEVLREKLLYSITAAAGFELS